MKEKEFNKNIKHKKLTEEDIRRIEEGGKFEFDEGIYDVERPIKITRYTILEGKISKDKDEGKS
jgi:hypothetical protein